MQAFQKGSPLVSDVSRAIINVTEGPKIKQIENKWIPQKDECSDSTTSVISHKLSLGNFWVLFSVAGGAAAVALVIYGARSRENNWNGSITRLEWTRFAVLARKYSRQGTIHPIHPMLEMSPSG